MAFGEAAGRPPEVGGLAKEIFRQNVEGIAWLLTAAHSKTGEREG